MSWRLSALALVFLAGCTTTKFSAMRSNYPPETKLKVTCKEFPDEPDEFDRRLRAYNDKGWRVSFIGDTTHNYLIFAKHVQTVCFEKPASSSGD
jgi:hypothetical protein